MDWMIDYMGGFRIILSKSSGNRFLHSSFIFTWSSILLASTDLEEGASVR
jgi:hypothetical protein